MSHRLSFAVVLVACVCITPTLLVLGAAAPQPPDSRPNLRLLFLGDGGHHRPSEMAALAGPALKAEGIEMDYSDQVESLSREKLKTYDAVLIFRDSGELPAEEEKALVEFVEGGRGLVAVHCASHCFRNSAQYTALVGGRFLRHGGETFRARIIDAQHPAMDDVASFESWDETYVHNELSDDRRVLMVRDEDGGYEPYTWVREQGEGRVYYTALGHDERTWRHPGFHKLLVSAVRWAARHDEPRPEVGPFQYVEAEVPNYIPNAKWGTTGEPIRRMQLPLTPEASMKHFHMPEGFRAELFAAEPNITKPLCMAWDERGRLWIAESVDYPNELKPQGEGRDRIKICEDTDGDGRADKFTIFAEGLSIPTSMVFAGGGLIAATAPDMVLLKDTDGDDRADVRKVLFTGWGTQDTHAGPSNLRYGFDNWVWGTVGYSGFEGSVGGRELRFGQGIFRFRPDGSALEFLSSTSNNTWGLGLSETGQVFASTANGEHSVYLAIPNRYFEAVRGWFGRGSAGIEDHKKFHPVTENVRQVDHHGGFTAAAGHAIYSADQFPAHYRNRAAFVCEPTGHLVHLCWLVPEGSGYVARDGYNLIAAADEWFAPIAAEVGPDGAVWIIDWYNFIVQHNPTPPGFETGKGNAYETPLRDKKHGRIYRIVYEGGDQGETPQLQDATSEELVSALSHGNLGIRLTAQRLLVERGQRDVVEPLAALVRDRDSGHAGMHALWTLDGLGALDTARAGDILPAALRHSSPAVRAAAARVTPRDAPGVDMLLEAGVLSDPEPQVRLAALLALAEMPGSRAAAQAVAGLVARPENAADRWIRQAAIAAAAPSGAEFLLAAAKSSAEQADGGRPSPPASGARAETAAAGGRRDRPARNRGRRADVVYREALPAAVHAVAEHLARSGEADVPRLVEALAGARPQVSEAALAGLAAGWPDDAAPQLDEEAAGKFQALASSLSPEGLLQWSALARKWNRADLLSEATASLRASVLARLENAELSTAARVAAARDLATLGLDDESRTAIVEQLGVQTPPELARGLLEALAEAGADEVGSQLVERLAELSPAARGAAIGQLLRRNAWTTALVDGLESGLLDSSVLSIDQAQQLRQHPDRELAQRAEKLLSQAIGALSPDRQKVVEALLPLTEREGDAAAGRVVFEQNCAKCHRHGELGATVGPDLTGVAARPKADILVDVLDPNRSVEGNFRQYTLVTADGLVLSGILAGETNTAIELLDAEARRHTVLREDIDSLTVSQQSIMPEGFEKLPEADLVNLLTFLGARGRYLPLSLAQAATTASDRGMFYSRESEVERLIFPSWGQVEAHGVPFLVVDPAGGKTRNVILLHGPEGAVSSSMPRSAIVRCGIPAKAIHLLSGISGWGHPLGRRGSISMIVRLHYADGQTEDHELANGVHFADYIREIDVPGSKLAFSLRGQQVRYLAIEPKRRETIEQIEFIKGEDRTAPIVVAVTVENAE